jgi:dipeptidyl aminopeptidase/acylaminoacyl peptidase
VVRESGSEIPTGGGRITAAMCAAGRSLASAIPAPDGERVALVARGEGSSRIVVVPASGGAELVVTADPPVMGCHPHGGGVFDWTPDGDAIVYVGSDGSLYRVDSQGGAGVLLRAVCAEDGENGEIASPVLSPTGKHLAFTLGGHKIVVRSLVDGSEEVVSGDADFVMDPVWHPSGDRLAWMEWDLPDMPWDSSRIALATLGSGKPPLVLAGGKGLWVSQPRFSPDGERIGYVSDSTGWPVVWTATIDGSDARPWSEIEGVEHAEASWGPGQRTFAFGPRGELAVSVNRKGHWHLQAGDVRYPGAHWSLWWLASGIVSIRSDHGLPTALVVVEADTGEASAKSPRPQRGDRRQKKETVLCRGPVGGFERDRKRRLLSNGAGKVEDISWPAPDGEPNGLEPPGALVYGRIYRSIAPGEHRLLVWVHGGPVGQMSVEFNARLEYLLEEGFDVMVPDFRGSTGWGRPYRQSLRGSWGERDVADVASGIRWLHSRGWASPATTAIMGASSGGMCVLLLLARHPELVAAGVDLYGVTDLVSLRERTHRFERHMTESLIGPLPEAFSIYQKRSPITLAHQIGKPLLVLHGSRDRVVCEEQSRLVVEAVASSGGQVDYHVYEGEGHGWSLPDTMADELVRITDFLDRHLAREEGAGPRG